MLQCAEQGHLEKLVLSLNSGADIHANDDYALRISAERGHSDIVSFLINRDADMSSYGDSALQNAALNGHLDVVKLLVKNGVSVTANDDYAIRCSIENKHYKVVKYLMKHGADVHFDVKQLRSTIRNGRSKMFKLLASRCKGLDNVGSGLAILGIRCGHLFAVKYLVKHCLSVQADVDDLMVLSVRRGQMAILQYLLENGANVRARDDSALETCVADGHLAIAKYLVFHVPYTLEKDFELKCDIIERAKCRSCLSLQCKIKKYFADERNRRQYIRNALMRDIPLHMPAIIYKPSSMRVTYMSSHFGQDISNERQYWGE